MGHGLYLSLDRAFWLIWLGFPAMVWFAVSDTYMTPAEIAALPEDMRRCMGVMPQVDRFSAAGHLVFWTGFSLRFVVYIVLLAMAHWVIHRCATGRVFVVELIGALRMIALIIVAWPVVDLLLSNAVTFALSGLGDLPAFLPSYALDPATLGVGLLLLTIAAAMRQAVELRKEADLTV